MVGEAQPQDLGISLFPTYAKLVGRKNESKKPFDNRWQRNEKAR